MAASKMITLTLDVSEWAPKGCRNIEVDLYVPSDSPEVQVLWCCVAGGGVSRSYFALDVAPELGDFNMARYLADRGAFVLLVDPPGVGGSDVPVDAYELTPSRLADVLHGVVTRVTDDLMSGRLVGAAPGAPFVTVGLGHSAGALLISSQQALHCSYDALALLGFSDTGLVEVLNAEGLAFVGRPDEVIAALPRLVKQRFGGPLPPAPYSNLDNPTSDGSSDPIQEAAARISVPLLALVGMMAIIPGTMKHELDLIDIPTFAAMGDHDIAGGFDSLVLQLPACRDLTLLTLADTGHNHNQSAARFVLWNRLIRWIESITQAT